MMHGADASMTVKRVLSLSSSMVRCYCSAIIMHRRLDQMLWLHFVQYLDC